MKEYQDEKTEEEKNEDIIDRAWGLWQNVHLRDDLRDEVTREHGMS